MHPQEWEILSDQEIERGAAVTTRWIANAHDREDAQQEYRIAVWRALTHVSPDRDPKPYQRASGRNAVRSFWHKKCRQPRPLSLDVSSQPSEGSGEPLYNLLPSKSPDPAKEAAARDLVKALRSQISKLPPRMRRVMEMSLEGLTTKQICKRLGFTRQAINRSKARARVLLRRRLEKGLRPSKPKKKPIRAA